MKEKYDNVCKILIAEKRGVSFARNIGIHNASGEYIAFVDGDDVVSRNFFEESYCACVDNNLDFVSGAINFIYKDTIKKMKPSIEKLKLFNCDLLRQHLIGQTNTLESEFGNYSLASPCAKLFRKEIIEDICFNEKIYHKEDLIYIYEVLSKCKRVGIVPDEWYNYYQYSNSALHTLDKRIIENDINIIKAVFEIDENINYASLCLFMYIVSEITTYSKYCEFKEAIRILKGYLTKYNYQEHVKQFHFKQKMKLYLINKELFLILYLFNKIYLFLKGIHKKNTIFDGECFAD